MVDNRDKWPRLIPLSTVTIVTCQCGRLLKEIYIITKYNNQETNDLYSILPSPQLQTVSTTTKRVLKDVIQLQERQDIIFQQNTIRYSLDNQVRLDVYTPLPSLRFEWLVRKKGSTDKYQLIARQDNEHLKNKNYRTKTGRKITLTLVVPKRMTSNIYITNQIPGK